MAADDDDEAPKRDYEVGFGKPPRQHQFKRGESGNAKGRPKGCRSTPEEVKHHLDGSMAVRIDGRSQKMNRRIILVHRLYERAAKGDNRATEIILRHDLLARSLEQADAKSVRAEAADDDSIIADFIARRSQREGEE